MQRGVVLLGYAVYAGALQKLAAATVAPLPLSACCQPPQYQAQTGSCHAAVLGLSRVRPRS